MLSETRVFYLHYLIISRAQTILFKMNRFSIYDVLKLGRRKIRSVESLDLTPAEVGAPGESKGKLNGSGKKVNRSTIFCVENEGQCDTQAGENNRLSEVLDVDLAKKFGIEWKESALKKRGCTQKLIRHWHGNQEVQTGSEMDGDDERMGSELLKTIESRRGSSNHSLASVAYTSSKTNTRGGNDYKDGLNGTRSACKRRMAHIGSGTYIRSRSAATRRKDEPAIVELLHGELPETTNKTCVGRKKCVGSGNQTLAESTSQIDLAQWKQPVGHLECYLYLMESSGMSLYRRDEYTGRSPTVQLLIKVTVNII